MRPEDYISSGILEAYVLGALTTAEAAEVEAMAAQHPAVRVELDAIRAAFEGTLLAYETPPPPALKDRMMAALAQEAANTPEAPAPPPPAARTLHPWFALAAAAAVALLISVGINFYQYRQVRAVRSEVTELRLSRDQLSERLQLAEARTEQLQPTLALLARPDLRVVTLQGQAPAPDARLTVFWSPQTGEVRLSANRLPTPPAGKQYQLWSLADGEPRDAGLLSPGEDELQVMRTTPTADAFAITLEQAGGSPTPTLEALYAIGEL